MVNDITCNGEITFTSDQVYELIFFCVLFAYVQYDPEDEDIELLKSYLNLSDSEITQRKVQYHEEIKIVKSPAIFLVFKNLWIRLLWI